MHLTAHADRCVFVVAPSTAYPNHHSMYICNSIGSIMDMKLLEFCPHAVHISKYHVIWISPNGSLIYAWQFRSERDINGPSWAMEQASITDIIGGNQLMTAFRLSLYFC